MSPVVNQLSSPSPRPAPHPRPNPIKPPEPWPFSSSPDHWPYCRRTFSVDAYNYRDGRWESATICEHCSDDDDEDQCELEWKNRYENDGTPDNSSWTSIETDGRHETSPSPIDDPDDAVLVEKKVINNETVTCVGCTFDPKVHTTMCFNGIGRVPI